MISVEVVTASPLIIKGFETPVKVYKLAPEEASENQGANSAFKRYNP